MALSIILFIKGNQYFSLNSCWALVLPKCQRLCPSFLVLYAVLWKLVLLWLLHLKVWFQGCIPWLLLLCLVMVSVPPWWRHVQRTQSVLSRTDIFLVKCYSMISCLLEDSLQYLFVFCLISSSKEYFISLVQAVGYVSKGSEHCFIENILWRFCSKY